MSLPPGRRAGLFSDGNSAAPPHCLLADAALFTITKGKHPMRVLFLRDHGIVADDHAAGRGGAGVGSGTEPVRYL
jgi:hypothetical protein